MATGETQWVGFYGCTGRLIRIAWTGSTEQRRQAEMLDIRARSRVNMPHTRRPVTTWRVRCPACRRRHRVNVTWRGLRPDEDPAPNIKLPEEALCKSP